MPFDAESLRSITDHEATASVALRRVLHRHPELSWQETATTGRVAEHLAAAGLEPCIRPEGTGLLVDVGRPRGPLVAFRADLDGLPIQETSAAEYASAVPGVMHACGHDAHTAIAAGIARTLAAAEDLPGRVRFLFQPAEEHLPGGAARLVAEGALDGVEAIAAFHVDPSLPPGSVGFKAGGITGASDRLRVTLTGPGGHTSRPHQTVDLIHTAARVITDLPGLLRRTIDPRRALVVAFGRVQGGTIDTAIPTEVQLGGTVRVFDADLWRSLPATVERMIHEIVTPLEAKAEVDYERGSPPVVNDPAVTAALCRAAEEALGLDAVLPTEQSLGSEDFAWYLESVPGCLIRLGSALPDRRVDLHASDFDIDERAVPAGILVGALGLIRVLEDRSG